MSSESSSDGFALYSADDRLIICNNRYRNGTGSSSALIKPGMHFRDLLLDQLRHGHIVEAKGRERDWIEQRLARFRHSSKPFELWHADGRACMCDLDMRYLACSKRWISDHGLEAQNVIGRSHYDLFPKIPEHWKEVNRRGLKGEILQSDKDCFIRADGTTQWVRREVQPWYANDGVK